jgi:putative phage-type endonuclease
MVEQGSPEWHAMRAGKVTASKLSDLLAKTKTGWGASRANYMAQLVAERLTGQVADSFKSPAMEWGTATEAEARETYEFYSDCVVTPVDFVPHPTIPMSGASPDGLLGSDGVLEIKCPNTSTHIETLLGQSVPSKYIWQIQWQLACTGRKWAEFVSYDKRMPEEMRLFVHHVDRDDEKIAEATKQVLIFLQEVEDKVAQLTKLYRLAEAA